MSARPTLALIHQQGDRLRVGHCDPEIMWPVDRRREPRSPLSPIPTRWITHLIGPDYNRLSTSIIAGDVSV
jgi:hypothetical protein